MISTTYKASVGLVTTAVALFAILSLHRAGTAANPSLEGSGDGRQYAARFVTVTRGPLASWSRYAGRVEAREVTSVSSQVDGPAVIVYLAADGESVKQGDPLVRFDTTDVERRIVGLRQEYASAVSELESLSKAELPIEIQQMKLEVEDQTHKVEQEDKFLADSKALESQGLLSAEEISEEQNEAKKEQEKLEQLSSKLALTRQYVHPAKLQEAEAKRTAAEGALKIAERQLESSTVLAPTSGTVVYKPINVGAEFRVARIGDTVYQNQQFLSLPDISQLVVRCEIPEQEFDRVEHGMAAAISPVGRAEISYKGEVESVQDVARSVPGMPDWQKYFESVVGVESGNSRLRPGMSVTVSVLTYRTESALLVPRTAVRWRDEQPYVLVKSALASVEKSVRLGFSDDDHFEILEGLDSGDEVVLP